MFLKSFYYGIEPFCFDKQKQLDCLDMLLNQPINSISLKYYYPINFCKVKKIRDVHYTPMHAIHYQLW